MHVRMVNDLGECRHFWRSLRGAETPSLFDLWEVRIPFMDAFGRHPSFVVVEGDDGPAPAGILPLCYISETGEYAAFPGEVWQNRTWLEGNRIRATDASILEAMVSALDKPVEFRYARHDCLPSGWTAEVDEVGYLFYPSDFDYSYRDYLASFAGKSRRKILKEIQGIQDRGVTLRTNCRAYIDDLFRMNMDAFGRNSYFSDSRFLRGFESLVSWLDGQDALLVTTVLVGGTVGAVDLGAVWNNQYTVLAGGVNPEFRGIAKLINFHHIETACRRRFKCLDFLCGDFGWKKRFHLTPRPLYKLAHKASADGGDRRTRGEGTA